MRKHDDTPRRTQVSAGASTPEGTRITQIGADQPFESQTNWARVHATTSAEIEAQAAADEAADGMVVDWSQVTSNRPAPKAVLNMRVDRDVLDFFRAEGRGYQTKINAVLRAYKEAHARKP